MFEAKMNQAGTLRKIVDSIKDLVAQVNLEASPNGISLQAMDSAHVSLVSLSLNESGFSEYRCDKNITLGLSLVELSKLLKMASSDDTVKLKSDSENSFLTIEFENAKSSKTSEFQLNLLTLDSESLGIPDTEYPTTVKMSSSEFFKICKELTTVADTVQIEIKDETLAKLSYTGKSGSGKINLKSCIGDTEDSIIITCQEEVNSRFGLSYLNNFSKASSLSTVVEINLSLSYPMMIHYQIEDIGFMKFYLAPKMDDDN